MTCLVAEDVLTVGSTYRFQLEATKNGTTWDITAATVTLRLRDGDGTLTLHTATVLSGPDGEAYFDCVVDFLTEGDWTRSWKISDGAVTITSLPIEFSVIDP